MSVKRPAKTVSRISIRQVTSTELRLATWQQSPDLVTEGMRLLADRSMQLAIAVLRNESPSNLALPPLGVTSEDRAAHQAKTEGYQLCLNNLEALGRAGDEPMTLEATFSDPDIATGVNVVQSQP